MKRKIISICALSLLISISCFSQDNMEIRDAGGNILMKVEDEGTGGSVLLPDLSGQPAFPADKLYNVAGDLYFNGLLVSSGAQSLTISNDTIFLSDGGFVKLPALLSDPLNELNEELVFQNDSLILTDLNGPLGVDLSDLKKIDENGLYLSYCDPVDGLSTGYIETDDPINYALGFSDQWQSFTAPGNGDINFLVWYAGFTVFSEATLEILEGEGIDGEVLFSMPLSEPVEDDWQQLPLPSTIPVVQGMQYTMRIYASSNFEWGFNDSNPYLGGTNGIDLGFGIERDNLFYVGMENGCVEVDQQVLSINSNNELSLSPVHSIDFADGSQQNSAGSHNSSLSFIDDTLHLTDVGGTLTADLAALRRIDGPYALNREECIPNGDFDTSAEYAIGGYTVQTADDFWQSFTANSSGDLERVSFHTTGGPFEFTGTLTIYSGEGIGGEVLATILISQTFLFNNWVHFNISSPPFVDAENKYTIRLQSDVGNIDLGRASLNPYPGGRSDYNNGHDYKFLTRIAVCVYTPIPVLTSNDNGSLLFTVDSLQFSDGSTQYTAATYERLIDADEDTSIQVEETSDEDIIRFDLAGTEFFTMDDGRFNVLNTGGSVFVGHRAGESEDLNYRNNVFVGQNAGRLTVSGAKNVAIGHAALGENITGTHNVAIGEFAMELTNGGNENVAIGSDAGYNNSEGDDNVFIGSSVAGSDNSSGSMTRNVMVGMRSGYQGAGSDNVFLGYQSGYNEAGSNKLYIENSNSPSPLIYGEFDTDLVRINGTLNINNSFSFPTTDGTSNQLLQTDGSGSLTWVNPIANTDNQTLSLLGSDLSIANGNTVDLSGVNTDNQTLSLLGNDLSIAGGNTLSLSGINTDDQSLSFSGTSLSIANGNTVDLSGINTDNQTLSLLGNDLSIAGGNTLSLSGINTDDQNLSFSGTSLSIANGNTVDLGSINTDEQTLSFSGTDLSIANGNVVDISGVDTDDQTLNLVGNILTIADGNSIDLSSVVPSDAILNTAVTNSEITGQAANIDITGQLEVTGEVQTFGNVKLGGAGDTTPPTITIGSKGTALASIIKVTVNIDLPNISSNDVLHQTVVVNNANIGATVFVSPANQLPGSVFIGYARVSSTNTVEITFMNEGGNGQDAPAMNYFITVIQ